MWPPGFAASGVGKPIIGTGIILAANAFFATYCDVGLSLGLQHLLINIGIRSVAIFFGLLVSVFIAKSRSVDELASERGSYLHAILDCGTRLTSLRSVHDLLCRAPESAVTQTNAGGGELLMLNEETRQLDCEASTAASESGQATESRRRKLCCVPMRIGS